jgi:Cyclic nucleotide-binding domain
VISEGDHGNKLYIVYRGELAIRKRVSEAEDHELARLTSGQIFGEMALFDDRERRSATVVAVRESELLALDREHFRSLASASRHSHGDLQGFSLSPSHRGPTTLKEVEIQVAGTSGGNRRRRKDRIAALGSAVSFRSPFRIAVSPRGAGEGPGAYGVLAQKALKGRPASRRIESRFGM